MSLAGITKNFIFAFLPRYQGRPLKQASQDLSQFEKGLLRIQRMAAAAGFGLRRLGDGISQYSQNIIRMGLSSTRTFADYQQEIFRLERNTDLAGPAFDKLNVRMEKIADTSGMLIQETKDIGINIAKTGILGDKIAEVNQILNDMKVLGDPSGELGKKYNDLSNNLIEDFASLTETLVKAKLVLDDFTEADTDVLVRGFVAITDQNQPLSAINEQLLQYIALIDMAAKNSNTNEKRIVQVAEKMNSVFKAGNVKPAQASVVALSDTIAVLGEQSRTVSNNFTDFLVTIRKAGKQEQFLKTFTQTSKDWGLTAENFNEKVFDSANFVNLMVDVMHEYGKAMKEGSSQVALIEESFPTLITKVGGRLGIEFEQFKDHYYKMFGLLQEHEQAVESVNQTYEKQSKSAQADLNRLDNSWTKLSADLSGIVIPIFRQFLDIIRENAQALKQWLASPENQQRLREFIEMAPKMLIYGIVAGELLKLAGSAILVISGIKNLVGVFTMLRTAAAFILPGGLLLLGIGSLILAFPELITHAENLWNWFKKLFSAEDIKEFFGYLEQDFKKFLENLDKTIGAVKNLAEIKKKLSTKEGAREFQLQNELAIRYEANKNATDGKSISSNLARIRAEEAIKDEIRQNEEIIRTFVLDIFLAIEQVYVAVARGLYDAFFYVGEQMDKFIIDATNGAIAYLGTNLSILKEGIFSVLEYVTSAFTEVGRLIKEYNIIDIMLNPMKYLFTTFEMAINEVIIWINSWLESVGFDKLPLIGSAPDGEKRKSDGNYVNTLYKKNNQTGAVIRKPAKLFGGRVSESRDEAILTPLDSSSSSPSMQQMANGQSQHYRLEAPVYLDNNQIGKIVTEWQIKNGEVYGITPGMQISGIGG